MRFFRYVKEAFFARPWGMWLPPNWGLIAGSIMLAIALHPGMLLIGAGLELGYLLYLATNPRFMHWVDAQDAFASKKTIQQQIAALLARLDSSDQMRYRQLEDRCRAMLNEQHDNVTRTDMQTQADGLSKLLFVYLRLLLTRNGILRVLQGASAKSIDLRMSEVQTQLKNAGTPELQQSLNDQLGILSERKKRHSEARNKLQFIEAELTRIQEQIELLREAMVMTTDPGTLSRQIDSVGQTLGATTQWIKQQQELMGQSEELLGDAPTPVLEVPVQAQKA
jgi:hypothetical protein